MVPTFMEPGVWCDKTDVNQTTTIMNVYFQTEISTIKGKHAVPGEQIMEEADCQVVRKASWRKCEWRAGGQVGLKKKRQCS